MSIPYLSIIYLFVGCIALSSCNASSQNKPLIGGDIGNYSEHPIEDTKAESIEPIVNTSAASEPEYGENLEIPAPLIGINEQILNRMAYTVSYNKDTKLPNWVAWELTADHINGPHKRNGIKFQEDEEVPSPRATDNDYRGSGYDRGHMCPSGDNKWDETAQQQSFLFTNICPQIHGLNAGDWNEMEGKCRRWAKKYGSVYIVCGPILYKGEHKTIGKNKVIVPEAFYKVVLRIGKKPSAIGFIYKNIPGNRPMGDYTNSIDQVERITGIDFFPSLPDNIENAIESEVNISDWQ